MTDSPDRPSEPGRPRRYSVRHRTEYTYDDEVTASYGRAFLLPRQAPGQLCVSTEVEVEPAADLLTYGSDFYGNSTAYLEVHTSHRRLVVTADSVIEVARQAPPLAELDALSWEQAVAAVRQLTGDAAVEAAAFMLASPRIALGAQVRAYAGEIFTAGRPFGESLIALIHRIHQDFTYTSGVTSVSTTLAEVLERRKGVCQDFAQLAVACLRCTGLPARYVSGYLETRPPPGKVRLQGADASHAWASVLLPDGSWLDLDPTNDRFIDDSFVVTAWGRDYTDVPPLKGVIFTESKESTLKVAVDVVRLG